MSVQNDPGFYLQGYHEDQQDQRDQQDRLHPLIEPKMSLLMCSKRRWGEGTAVDSGLLSGFAVTSEEKTNAHLRQ